MKKIAIIGGGASGLIAAYYAAHKDNHVSLFEKQKTIGRKLLATGNGRCNISNVNLHPSKYNGKNPKIINNIFSRYGLEETRDFFLSIGVPFVEEKNGKLFPSSLQAVAVKETLEYEILKNGVDLKLHRRIDKIINNKGKFFLETAGKEKFTFDSVILATGSCAFPSLGASKSGYALAKSLKHTVYDSFPAILPLNIIEKKIRKLQGIKCDTTLKVFCDNKILRESTGELLFTKYGISGPVTLDISRKVNELLILGKKPIIKIDFFPELSIEDLNNLLKQVWTDPEKGLAFSLIGIIKKKIPNVLFEMIGIDPDLKVGGIDKKNRESILNSLKNFEVTPGESRGFEEAVVAAGGVDVNEINPATMESKIVKNLFLTGELLDIDGISGGFNLQFAWSTGAIAGMSQ